MEEEKTKNRENSRVAKAAGVVGVATMLSRIFGFIRDMDLSDYPEKKDRNIPRRGILLFPL
jgi:hypothetical protein